MHSLAATARHVVLSWGEDGPGMARYGADRRGKADGASLVEDGSGGLR